MPADTSKRAESRKHPRAPIALKVEYRRMNMFFSDYTRNISKGGTFIATEKPLGIGTEFLFRLHIPAFTDAVELHGRVVWTNTPDNKQRADVAQLGMGIEFVYGTASKRRAFERDVEKLMVQALGERVTGHLIGKK